MSGILPDKVPTADLFCKQPTALANVTSKIMCARSRQTPHDTSRILYRIALAHFMGHRNFQQQEG